MLGTGKSPHLRGVQEKLSPIGLHFVPCGQIVDEEQGSAKITANIKMKNSRAFKAYKN